MSISLNPGTFHARLSGRKPDKEGNAIEYTVTDSTYCIYNPTVVDPATWYSEPGRNKG